LLQRRDLAFGDGRLAAVPHELIDGWHLRASAPIFPEDA
jgi:hypothetical protein